MKPQKASCVFCKIVKGELPVSMIYEDEMIAVFVDLYPVNEGHLLIIPKYHAAQMSDVDTKTLQHIITIAKDMNAALRRSKFKCEGVNLLVADGKDAGQEVFHFHLHVIPRYKGDGFGFRFSQARHLAEMQRHQMDDIAGELREQINAIRHI